MNKYEEKIERKIEYAKNKASSLKRSSDSFFSKGFCERTGIPMGQPILVGHHSERRHRNTIKRYENQMRNAIKDSEKAEFYKDRATRLENNTVISSDDPEAVKKLKEKIHTLNKSLERKKELNRRLRTFKTKTNAVKEVPKLPEDDKDKKYLVKMLHGCDFWAHPPDRIRAYYLETTSNTAEIRRLKQRITQLQKLGEIEETEKEYGDVTLKINKEENRVQLFFPGKPSGEVRTKLKRNGFRWAPSNGCWQTYIHSWTIKAGEKIAKNYGDDKNEL